MDKTTINELYLFLIFVGIGILIVLIFDIFRISRKSFKTNDLITYIEDIIFSIISGTIALYSIFKFNNGELRFYVFLGMLLGGIIYLAVISKIFIKVNVIIIEKIKKVMISIFIVVIFPFKIILKFSRKLFLKPISFFFFNLKNISTNIKKKSSNIIGKKQ